MIRCKEEIIFPNELSMQEHLIFLHNLIYDMINDLGIITGVDVEILFEDYKFRNGTNLVKDVLKSKGIDTGNEESVALKTARGVNKNE